MNLVFCDSSLSPVTLFPCEFESEGGQAPQYYEYGGSKSVEAFKLTVNRFFAKHKKVYLWTFTFADVISLSESSKRWARLRTILVRKFGLDFIRVLERHQSDHGVHFHALIPRWFNVHKMRRYARRCGFGRVNVIEQVKSARFYLAKHFSKTRRGTLLAGRRLWACCGMSKDEPTRCKVASLTVWTREHEIYRGLARIEKESRGVSQLSITDNSILWAKAVDLHTSEIVAGRKLVADHLCQFSRSGATNLVFN